MLLPIPLLFTPLYFTFAANALPSLLPRDDFSPGGQAALFNSKAYLADSIKSVMLGSIRTSWEQGTAAAGVLEHDNPEYSVFAGSPFANNGNLPATALQLAFSAAVRQGPDGRLSQEINDGLDGAALDGASAGPYVLLGTFTEPSRADYFQSAAEKQLNYLLNTAPKTSTGAISMRNDGHAYWNDGVFMGPPFLAYYGALTNDQSLLQQAFDNVRLYREALLIDGPTGRLWAHIYNEDEASFWDKGLWATGNAWAALGIIRVEETIRKSAFADQMRDQLNELQSWTKEILDGTFAAIRSEDDLIPNYIDSNNTFGDAAASAALASVAYRAAVISSDVFGSNYTEIAGRIAKAVLNGVDEIGVISPYVDPLSWEEVGLLSTEGQAFALMMVAGWRAWLTWNGQYLTA
ncbi:hypothetical protein ACEPAF_9892 [Sanghuangporus sanghuang]